MSRRGPSSCPPLARRVHHGWVPPALSTQPINSSFSLSRTPSLRNPPHQPPPFSGSQRALHASFPGHWPQLSDATSPLKKSRAHSCFWSLCSQGPPSTLLGPWQTLNKLLLSKYQYLTKFLGYLG